MRTLASRMRASVWWAAGTACCVTPVAASLWTPNRSAAFHPAVGLAVGLAVAVGVVVGVVVGPAWACRHDGRVGTALLVATTYPISLAVALGIEGVEREQAWGTAGLAVIIGAALGGIAPALRLLTAKPATALRRGSVGWAVASALTIPLLGIGLGIPQVVSYRLAACRADEWCTD